ncbi:MAG: alpha/beta hydrolase, partial [Clostridiales bacterium]|nr:alpha/beta hydrolase [Clostridiales bacterium]
EPIKNIYTALAFLKQNAKTYNIDIDNVYVGGDSAGATLAMTLGAVSTNPSYKDFFELPKESKDIRFKGLAPICGMYDMRTSMASGFPHIREYLTAYADKSADELLNDEDSKYLSPIRFINKELPPTFVITGERDALKSDGFELVEKLKEYGIKYGHFHGEGKSAIHAFPVGQLLSTAKDALNAMLDFFLIVP